MNRYCLGILLIALCSSAFANQAQATEIQWATGCTSLGRTSDILSVSYNSDSEVVTLYRTRVSSAMQDVTAFTTNSFGPLWEPVTFRATGGSVLVAIFESKSTIEVLEDGVMIPYSCSYYSLARE